MTSHFLDALLLLHFSQIPLKKENTKTCLENNTVSDVHKSMNMYVYITIRDSDTAATNVVYLLYS